MSPVLLAPPLSLYVHMPWCVRKCPYCDFNSHAAPSQLPEQRYIDALLEDLDVDLDLVGRRPIRTIFFGGGTPSLFSPEEIARLLGGVRARLSVDQDAEITLEANPGTIEHGQFAGYRAAGINRVSLGAQSFNEAHLRALGRIHHSSDIARAVEELRRAGIDNVNLDLMYALPAQTLEQSLEDVDQALALSPTHISHYQLTLEPGTVFYHRPPALPPEDDAWEIQQHCQDRLAREGFQQYEVSAYARPQRRCAHNLNYWSFGDYLGIGAGAHGKITDAAQARIIRTFRTKQPREYLQRSPNERAQYQSVAQEEISFEFMLNALRLVDGFDVRDFMSRTGLPLSCISAQLEAACSRGMLQMQQSVVCPTELGRLFLNDLQGLFLPSDKPCEAPPRSTTEIAKGERKLVN
jgi:putative oxygen-independent coproporphyrinogen III oxidase